MRRLLVATGVAAAATGAIMVLGGGKKTAGYCAERPPGIAPEKCLKLLPDGGTRDFGDENVMRPGQWVGDGCRKVACTVMAGRGKQ